MTTTITQASSSAAGDLSQMSDVMPDADINAHNRPSNASNNTYLMVPMLIFFALLVFAVIRGPNLISAAGIGSAVIVVAPLILATYALTIIVMAGRAGVDLSMGPLIGFINVGLIQLFAAGFIESPIAFFLYAMGVGIAYQLLQGLIIIFVRVQPIIVSLSGYLTLVGLNLIIMPRPGGVAPEWMFAWGSGTSLFSAVLVILLIATAGWYLISRTAFFGHLRLMGSDERAAYTSGVHVNWVRLGAHAIGGVYAGLAAITFTSLISSGDPTQGTTYTLMAVTALVLGGANLAGGRGSAFGSLLGALNIYLITYVLSTFNFGKVQSFVTDLAYGVMLVVSLLISVAVPHLQKHVRHLSPLMFFVILAVVALGVIMHTSMDQQLEPLVGVSASASAMQLQSASELSDSASAGGYSAGTYILFIVLGAAAVITVFRQLIRHPSPSMTGLVVLLAAVTLGLVFNPSADQDTNDNNAAAVATSNEKPWSPDIYTLESHSIDSSLTTPVTTTSSVVLTLAGTVLLTSLIILVMLPHVQMRTKRIAMFLFGCVVAVVAIGALFFDSFEQGYLASTLSGEVYAILLVGVSLFALMGPLVHTRLSNITHVFIVFFGVLALVCVYFFTSPVSDEESGAGSNLSVQYADSIFNKVEAESSTPPVAYSKPARHGVDAPEMNAYTKIAFAAIVIVLLHIFLFINMEERSFKSFWRHWEIPVFSALLWGSLLYSTGLPLWQIVAVIAVAILAAPNIMHIISTYLIRQQHSQPPGKWSG